MQKYITKNYKQTQKLGEKISQEILNCKKNKEAVVLLLKGDLGGGKTTFLQGFAKGLGVKEKVLSPTFVIMKKFPIFSKKPTVHKTPDRVFCVLKYFYHIDCYRLKNYKDAVELGLKDILKNPENIVAIEWPEKISKILPKDAIKINFKFINKNTREVLINLKKIV
jgi:tRNA threonylcarbamoyladenosine biosynthesis protein TsaE